MFPAIFIDRDGVIIENRSEYVREWSQVSVIQNAIRSLSNSKLKKYKIVIVTNQSAVGRGIITLDTAKEINYRLINLINNQGGRIDCVYLCPHAPDDNCDCRKPKPELLLRAAKELSLDLKRSWMIGDAWSDVQAGQAASVRGSILVKTGRGADQLSLQRPEGIKKFFVSTDLTQAIDTIIQQDSKV